MDKGALSYDIEQMALLCDCVAVKRRHGRMFQQLVRLFTDNHLRIILQATTRGLLRTDCTQVDLYRQYLGSDFCKNEREKYDSHNYVGEAIRMTHALVLNLLNEGDPIVLADPDLSPAGSEELIKDLIIHIEANKLILKECTARFLSVTLPGALWKREYDHQRELTVCERWLLRDAFLNMDAHPCWREIERRIRLRVLWTREGKCRGCGIEETRRGCNGCRSVRYCGASCKLIDMKDPVYGHQQQDCILLNERETTDHE